MTDPKHDGTKRDNKEEKQEKQEKHPKASDRGLFASSQASLPGGGTPYRPPTEEELNPLTQFKEKILADYDRLGLEDEFQFGCHPGVPCFNECCSDVNIFLTPYDVLRMRRALNMESAEFLEKYTQIPVQKDQKYPVVMFKMDHGKDNKPCQLVSEKGCTIYEDRPWPCRMYPLGLASPKEDGSGEEEFYFLMKEDVCHGFEESKQWTVGEWIADQGMEPYEDFGRLYKEITLHDWFERGRPLSPEKMELFYMACYDLDSFRRFILGSTFLKRFEVEDELLEQIKSSDEDLLRFAHSWLKFALYGEKTITVRPEAMPPSSAAKSG